MSDVAIVFRVQAIRAALYGFGSIMIGASLAQSGLDAGAVGLVFTAMLVGMAVASLAGSAAGAIVSDDGEPTRRLLGVIGLAGSVFALTDALPLLLVAALTGCLSTDPNESGPITTLEQAMLPARRPPNGRAGCRASRAQAPRMTSARCA